MAIHRKEQIVLLTDTDGTTENFVFDIKANKGSSSQFEPVTVQNDHIFYDAGVWSLGQTGTLDQIVIKNEISVMINNTKTGFINGLLDTDRIDENTVLHNREKKEVWFYFPINNLTYFQYVYVYDYQQNMWYRRISPQETTCAIEHKDTIYSFDSSGNVYQEDLGSDWNGTDLDWYVQTAYLNFGEEHLYKDIDDIRILTDSSVENNFNYKFLFDYDSFFSTQTKTFETAGDADALTWSDASGSNTSTVWADNSSGDSWAKTIVAAGYIDKYNGFKGISLYFSGTGTQNLGIMSIDFVGVNVNSV